MNANAARRIVATLAVLAAVAIGASPPASADAGDRTTAVRLLQQLPLAVEDTTGYDRDLFRHWTSQDGCTTREWVLIRQAVAGSRSGCLVAGGRWFSRYDGVQTTDPSSFDIDHMVPLAEAWGSGADEWSDERRSAFANDLGFRPSLIAVSASSNRSKSDRDPAEWMPPAQGYWCKYLKRWVAVKFRWGLAVDRAERTAVRTGLASCSKAMREPPTAP